MIPSIRDIPSVARLWLAGGRISAPTGSNWLNWLSYLTCYLQPELLFTTRHRSNNSFSTRRKGELYLKYCDNFCFPDIRGSKTFWVQDTRGSNSGKSVEIKRVRDKRQVSKIGLKSLQWPKVTKKNLNNHGDGKSAAILWWTMSLKVTDVCNIWLIIFNLSLTIPINTPPPLILARLNQKKNLHPYLASKERLSSWCVP